jgi:hypothetical protein
MQASRRAVAQAVSRRLPTEAPRVRAWFRSCEMRGGQVDTRAGFLRVLRFALPSIPATAPHSFEASLPRSIISLEAVIMVENKKTLHEARRDYLAE